MSRTYRNYSHVESRVKNELESLTEAGYTNTLVLRGLKATVRGQDGAYRSPKCFNAKIDSEGNLKMDDKSCIMRKSAYPGVNRKRRKADKKEIKRQLEY